MHRSRIVAADDSVAFLEQIVAVLGVEFDVVATARDGVSALDLIRQYMPDVVVLDIHMPGLSGIDLTRQLGKGPGNVPVVICSVEKDPDVIEAAKCAGAFGYVIKSRVQRDLVPAVKLALQLRGLVPSIH
ncbi:MAG TPA: response regulator transcription factor [Candidatus Sulfotelmatobacter sp.]|nr:response regulator transcription factor [Candidatus Sulfotelmatobacter sp.]